MSRDTVTDVKIIPCVTGNGTHLGITFHEEDGMEGVVISMFGPSGPRSTVGQIVLMKEDVQRIFGDYLNDAPDFAKLFRNFEEKQA